jgi:folate-dependent phosphoribosylglycinamide formyltransferase PurN
VRICLLTSNSLRHAHVAHRLGERFELGLVLQERKGVAAYYQKDDEIDLVEEHFQRLADTEQVFFGSRGWESVGAKIESFEWGELNTEENARLVGEYKPDAVAVFGCGIIKTRLLDILPAGKTFNIHQGLSPYLRGVGTNFWPFVTGELEYIGVTLHIIDAGIDTGAIVAHERPDIEPFDTQHTLGCKTVVKSADLLVKALEVIEGGGALHAFPQWQKGKLYRKADLTPDSILEVRRREREGYVADFVSRRNQGLVRPLQLIRLEK